MSITKLPVEILNDCADYATDPANPALRTTGGGGGSSNVSGTVAISASMAAVNPLMDGGRASAARPSAAWIADNDAQVNWLTPSGAQVIHDVPLSSVIEPVVVTVNTTADPLVAAENVLRKSLMVFNKSAERAYFGPGSGVTTSAYTFFLDQYQGWEIPEKMAMFRWYGVTAATSADITVTEGIA